MAPESHLWRGWGRQDSGRLRKKEKWGTWKERNRNPPGLPNLPFSEKEKKNSGSREKIEFLWTNKMGNCCGTEAGSKEHVYIFWKIFFIRNFKIFQIFFYDLAEIISVLDGYKLRYRDIFLMADSYTDKVIFSTF